MARMIFLASVCLFGQISLVACWAAASTECGSRRVFVDLGANDGQSLLWFEKTMHQKAPFTDVWAFEMNPSFRAPLTAILARFPKAGLEQAAAWTQDGAMSALMQLPGSRTGSKGGVFYNMTASSLQVGGVPLNRESAAKDRARHSEHEGVMEVRTVDFASWLSARYCKSDYIFVKVYHLLLM